MHIARAPPSHRRTIAHERRSASLRRLATLFCFSHPSRPQTFRGHWARNRSSPSLAESWACVASTLPPQVCGGGRVLLLTLLRVGVRPARSPSLTVHADLVRGASHRGCDSAARISCTGLPCTLAASAPLCMGCVSCASRIPIGAPVRWFFCPLTEELRARGASRYA